MNNYYNSIAKDNFLNKRLLIFLVSCLALFYWAKVANYKELLKTNLASNYIQASSSSVSLVFETVNNLSSSTLVKENDIVMTNGYYSIGDSGAATFKILFWQNLSFHFAATNTIIISNIVVPK